MIVSGLHAIKVIHEAAPGSKFVEWKLEEGVDIGGCADKGTECVAAKFGAGIKIKAIFELSGPPPVALTINEPGTGAGQVNCEVGGGPTVDKPCASSYPQGTELKLIAAPGEGSAFEGFENATGSAAACSTSPCGPFKLEAASELDAVFDPIPRALAVNATGEGEVECKVGAGPAEPCEPSYPDGTKLTLVPEAEAGSEFLGFENGAGSASGCAGTSPCAFTIKADSEVDAPFDLIPRTLTIGVTGEGEVECDPGTGPEPCQPTYPNGTELTLVPIEETGSEFAGWKNGTGSIGCTGTAPCTFTIEANSSVEATFALIGQKTLTIDTSGGTGTGSVNCEVNGGERTDEPCHPAYTEGTQLKLIPVPALHSEFAGYNTPSGSIACTALASCEFTINANSSVNAPFSAKTHTIGVTLAGTGSGTVQCKFGAGSFESCAGPHNEGLAVEVKDTPALHSAFAGFSAGAGSAAACATSPCAFNLEADSTLTATNNQKTHTIAITLAGSGTGTVECKFGAGSFESCAGPHNEGLAVEVKDTPAAHSAFAGFSAGSGSASTCSTSPCAFNLEADSALTATNNQITHTLAVTLIGSGAVECKEDAGAFGSCAVAFKEGHSVTVKDTPAVHWSFAGFSSGAGSASACTTSPCTFTIEADSALTATNTHNTHNTHTLTATVSGPGSVSAGGSPAPVSGSISACTSAGGANCTATYNEADTVTLTATPGAHQQVAWTGCDSHTATTCTVAVNANAAVTDTETTIAHTLTITKAGSGSVSCNGAPCASSYAEGTEVTLAATAASGSTFAGWSGAGCSGTGACKVTLEADTTVTATFTATPPPPTCATDPSLCPPPPPPAEEKCTVPKLAGKTLGQARSALSAAHCALGKVSKPKKAKGSLVVKSSSPGAGTTLPAGSKVNLKLGPKPKKKK